MNKISDNIRKRAFFGVAIFCITAIATVGALSMGGKDDTPSPDALVDLNETDPEKAQVADGKTGENTEPGVADTEADGQQVAEQPGVSEGDELQQTAESTPNAGDAATQVAEGETDASEAGIAGVETGSEQVAEQPEVKTEEPVQTADGGEATEPEQTEVLSPQLIAEQLQFDRSMGLMWPVQGDVVIPYSPEHGVYHYTLDQFGTSEAMVLSSTVGAEVKAAAKGVVVSIEEDVRTGTTVTLALGNNTSLVYGQLDVADLKEGDVVEAGACLGTVAEPTRYYVVEGPNLYFQVKEGEESVDPGLLLKEE